MSVDLYDILGVEPDASAQEVKSAYRRLAFRYHPDQNPGDREAEERFKEVTHAYEVLSDPQKRRAYDRLNNRSISRDRRGPTFEDFGEVFEVLNSVISAGFGSLGRSEGGRRGKDIRVELSIPLEEAMTGVRRDVTVPRPRECVRCSGSGAEPGTALRTCKKCKGKGQIRIQQGFFSLLRDCDRCRGRGRVPETSCRRCEGSGQIEGTELLPIDVPAGVRDGQTLRWSGKGVPAAGNGDDGDLLVDVVVEEHELFARDGQDIHLVLPVSFTQASLGAKVDVPTLDGAVRMKVPAGTQSGRVFRLRGKGLPAIGDRPGGDQYVRLEVTSPEKISQHQEKLREKYAAKSGRDKEQQSGIWGRIRQFFE